MLEILSDPLEYSQTTAAVLWVTSKRRQSHGASIEDRSRDCWKQAMHICSVCIRVQVTAVVRQMTVTKARRLQIRGARREPDICWLGPCITAVDTGGKFKFRQFFSQPTPAFEALGRTVLYQLWAAATTTTTIQNFQWLVPGHTYTRYITLPSSYTSMCRMSWTLWRNDPVTGETREMHHSF
jgi:hypothetical protein